MTEEISKLFKLISVILTQFANKYLVELNIVSHSNLIKLFLELIFISYSELKSIQHHQYKYLMDEDKK